MFSSRFLAQPQNLDDEVPVLRLVLWFSNLAYDNKLAVIPAHLLGAAVEVKHDDNHAFKSVPIGSMYAIYANIYHQYTPNVSIYAILGSYGVSCHHHKLGYKL